MDSQSLDFSGSRTAPQNGERQATCRDGTQVVQYLGGSPELFNAACVAIEFVCKSARNVWLSVPTGVCATMEGATLGGEGQR